MSNTSSPTSLFSASTLARPDLSTSVFTHSDHVLQGLPSFVLSGSGKFVIDLIQDVARCTWSYHHLGRRKGRTDVVSSMSTFRSREADGVSSLSLMPEIQRIMARSLRRIRRISDSFGPLVSLPRSLVERTQAWYPLPRILRERCLVVKTGKSFLNFAKPHGIWQQWHCHSSHQSTAYHLGSRTWLPNQAWCRRYPLQS